MAMAAATIRQERRPSEAAFMFNPLSKYRRVWSPDGQALAVMIYPESAPPSLSTQLADAVCG